MGEKERLYHPERLIGASCHEVIREILRLNPEIEAMRFTTYSYVYLAIEKDKIEPHFWINREEILEGDELERQIEALPEGSELGIHSHVRMKDGSIKYLSMMNFRSLEPSLDIQERAKEKMKEIVGMKGPLLRTDRSFHFYGLEPVDFEEWLNFNARCLLTSIVEDKGKKITDIVSTRYIGHCLLRRANVLRISNNFRQVMPTVVDYIR